MEAFNGAGIRGEIPEKTGAAGVDTGFYRKTPEKAGVHQKK